MSRKPKTKAAVPLLNHPAEAFAPGTRRKGVRRIKRLLVANRSEIAIRVFRACTELGIGTVGIYSHEDKLALHRYKCDEAYLVGEGKGPVAAYLDMEGII